MPEYMDERFWMGLLFMAGAYTCGYLDCKTGRWRKQSLAAQPSESPSCRTQVSGPDQREKK